MRLLALLLAASLWTAPKPTPSLAVHQTAGAVWIVYTVTLTGNAPDSTVVVVKRSATDSVAKKLPTSKTDSVSFPHAAEGVATTWTAVATSYWRGAAFASPAKTVSYTEPVSPKPTITTLRANPVSFTTQAGKTTQVCVAAKWSDGSWTRVIPWPQACEAVYPTLIAS